MDEWADAVLRVLDDSGSPIALADLKVRIGQELQRRVEPGVIDSALAQLTRLRQVVLRDSTAARIEPDFKEHDLEDEVERHLKGRVSYDWLQLAADNTVFEKTTSGGLLGAGRWSRPDFTIATIRQWRFDPLRHLDVISFELKNRTSSDVVAVHEALAHTRFSHFAFLVCPRSKLRPSINEDLAQECVRHGVGLALFDLRVGPDDRPVVENFEFERAAVRGSPDPGDVEQHLKARLSVASQDRLSELVRPA